MDTGWIRTVDGEPAEHAARLEPALHLVDPLVVERHSRGALLALELARLHVLPEVVRVHVLDRLGRVERPAALHRRAQDAERRREHGALRRRERVHVAAKVEHDRADEEDDGREGVGEVEADVLRAGCQPDVFARTEKRRDTPSQSTPWRSGR